MLTEKETKVENKIGVIYILTNPSFKEYVKIGYADDLEKRLKSLNRSECIPYAFRAYATYDVYERLKDLDIHNMIDRINPTLRSIETFDGKERKREFYAMDVEDAYNILETIAKLSGTEDRLHKLTPEGHEISDEEIAEEIREEYTDGPFAWCIRSENDNFLIDNNCIAIGWDELGDLNQYKNSKALMKEKWIQLHPELNTQQVGKAIGQVYNFICSIKINDFVMLICKNGRIRIGKVTGEYEYTEDYSSYHNIRKVEWLGEYDKNIFSKSAKNEIGCISTLFRVKRNYEEFISKIS